MECGKDYISGRVWRRACGRFHRKSRVTWFADLFEASVKLFKRPVVGGIEQVLLERCNDSVDSVTNRLNVTPGRECWLGDAMWK